MILVCRSPSQYPGAMTQSLVSLTDLSDEVDKRPFEAMPTSLNIKDLAPLIATQMIESY